MTIIQLTQGERTIVCDCHAHLVTGYKWTLFKTKEGIKYAYRKDNKKSVMMHRIIANTPTSLSTDHIDGNGLNNQCSNLRIVTVRQNNMNKRKQINNTSGYPGVRWKKDRGKWLVEIKINGKAKFLGYFEDIDEAIKVRKNAVKKHYGEYARTI